MRKILKVIYQFFLTINIYESSSKPKKVNKNKNKIFFIKSLNELKNTKTLQKYFEKKELEN